MVHVGRTGQRKKMKIMDPIVSERVNRATSQKTIISG